jgi:malate dehydrogenase
VSMAVCSPGAYDVEEGLISSFPCRCNSGKWEIVEGLDVNEFSRERIDTTVDELKQERDTIKQQGLI